MEMNTALEAFYALSQETRLKLFRILIEYGSQGTTPSKIAERLGVPDNTLSFHLSHLSKSGLVSAKRDGRSLIYSANCDLIEQLIGYMKENCCALGDAACCPPQTKKRRKK
jgi:ArsR family transcriptional regulator